MQRSKLKKFVLDGLLGVLFGILLWPVIKYYSLSNLPTVLYPLVLPYGLGFMAAIGLGMRGAPAPWTEAAPVLLAVCSLFFAFYFFLGVFAGSAYRNFSVPIFVTLAASLVVTLYFGGRASINHLGLESEEPPQTFADCDRQSKDADALAYCYHLLMAGLRPNAEVCNKLRDTDIALQNCKVAIEGDIQHPEECLKLRHSEAQESCLMNMPTYAEMAESGKDGRAAASCEFLKSPNSLSRCYTNAAVATRNKAYCKKIPPLAESDSWPQGDFRTKASCTEYVLQLLADDANRASM